MNLLRFLDSTPPPFPSMSFWGQWYGWGGEWGSRPHGPGVCQISLSYRFLGPNAFGVVLFINRLGTFDNNRDFTPFGSPTATASLCIGLLVDLNHSLWNRWTKPSVDLPTAWLQETFKTMQINIDILLLEDKSTKSKESGTMKCYFSYYLHPKNLVICEHSPLQAWSSKPSPPSLALQGLSLRVFQVCRGARTLWISKIVVIEMKGGFYPLNLPPSDGHDTSGEVFIPYLRKFIAAKRSFRRVIWNSVMSQPCIESRAELIPSLLHSQLLVDLDPFDYRSNPDIYSIISYECGGPW